MIFKQFLSFAFVGSFGTVFHYAVLICIVSGFQGDPIAGTMLGFIVGTAVNYFGNYYITFQSKKGHKESSLRFFFIAFFGFTLNWVIMKISPEIFNFHYLVNQSFSTIIVLCWNFTGNKLWTFR